MNPRRNSIEMDLFPTNLVDNLVIMKTQTANLPETGQVRTSAWKPKTFPSNSNSTTALRWA